MMVQDANARPTVWEADMITTKPTRHGLYCENCKAQGMSNYLIIKDYKMNVGISSDFKSVVAVFPS